MSDSTPNPQYKPGDIVNGHVLIAHPDGRMEWVPATPPAPGADVGGPAAAPPKKSRRGLLIALGVVGGVLLLAIVVGSLNRPSIPGNPVVANSPVSDEREADAEPEPEMVAVPAGLVGMTASEAESALAAVGLNATYDGEPTARVLSVSPESAEVEVGSTITLTVEQPPALTLAQENAVRKAESYLQFMAFSRTGLIGQLEFEGFTTEEATFAVDFVNPDWNAQAAAKAESYLEMMSFSRQGLYDQLIFEGFTPEQANAGLAAVGY